MQYLASLNRKDGAPLRNIGICHRRELIGRLDILEFSLSIIFSSGCKHPLVGEDNTLLCDQSAIAPCSFRLGAKPLAKLA